MLKESFLLKKDLNLLPTFPLSLLFFGCGSPFLGLCGLSLFWVDVVMAAAVALLVVALVGHPVVDGLVEAEVFLEAAPQGVGR